MKISSITIYGPLPVHKLCGYGSKSVRFLYDVMRVTSIPTSPTQLVVYPALSSGRPVRTVLHQTEWYTDEIKSLLRPHVIQGMVWREKNPQHKGT